MQHQRSYPLSVLEMAAISLLAIYLLLLGGGAYASPASRADYSAACQAVEAAIGSSKVFYPGEFVFRLAKQHVSRRF